MSDGFLARVNALKEQGFKTHADIAAEMDMSVRTFRRRLKDHSATQSYHDHSWAIPWVLGTEHAHASEAQMLRRLSRAAHGLPPHSVFDLNTAFRWARETVEAGLDLSFSPEDGFKYVPADVNHWHLQSVLRAAEEATAKRS